MNVINSLISMTTALIALVIVCIIGAAVGWDNKVADLLSSSEEAAEVIEEIQEETTEGFTCRWTGWRCSDDS